MIHGGQFQLRLFCDCCALKLLQLLGPFLACLGPTAVVKPLLLSSAPPLKGEMFMSVLGDSEKHTYTKKNQTTLYFCDGMSHLSA